MPLLFETFAFFVFAITFARIGWQVLVEKRQLPEVRLQKHFGDVQSLLLNKDYHGVLRVLQKRIHEQQGSRDIAYCLKAEAQYALGRYEQALKDSYRSLSANIYYVPAYIQKLKAAFALGNYALAKKTCSDLKRLAPTQPESYFYEAFIADAEKDAQVRVDKLYAQASHMQAKHR